MTNIESLPLCLVSAGFAPGEDVVLPLMFLTSDYQSLSLAGITFTATVQQPPLTAGVPGATIATLTAVVAGNLLTLTALAVTTSAWLPQVYTLECSATDGTHTKQVFDAGSAIDYQTPAPMVATVVTTGGQAPVPVVSAISAQAVQNSVAISALQASVTPTPVFASAPITLPGVYVLMTTGISVTLGALTQQGLVVLVDGTGASNPNQTIAGTINGTTNRTFTTAYQALVLSQALPSGAWVILAT